MHSLQQTLIYYTPTTGRISSQSSSPSVLYSGARNSVVYRSRRPVRRRVYRNSSGRSFFARFATHKQVRLDPQRTHYYRVEHYSLAVFRQIVYEYVSGTWVRHARNDNIAESAICGSKLRRQNGTFSGNIDIDVCVNIF